MTKKSLPAVFLFLAINCLFAQENRFFMPLEIQNAYESGARSYDGRPGPAYWQNTVDYTIEVTVDPAQKKISGSEKAVYHNNSPDALSILVVRLYYDAFKKGSARDYGIRPGDITDGVEVSALSVDGKEVEIGNRKGAYRSGTHLVINLPEPLLPGKSLSMEISWAQFLPETTIRTGVYDSTTFFVAYWHPQIAVYDDVFGWDRLDYGFRAEFYNNLGNYDVTINAPEQFTVLATGMLQNAADVLPEDALGRYRQALASAETVAIIGPDALKNGYRSRQGGWHYVAREVSDFAFCLSDHYCWDAAAQEVDGRPVFISTYYPENQAEQCSGVTAMQQKIMKHFSEDVPGIPYPYPAFTTFIASGGGGMEYPMMANNGGPGRGVTIHEMFHTYFPMYVRTNEKRFAWMDEGWADYITEVVTARYFNNEEGPHFSGSKSGMQGAIGTISDLPLITSTQFMDNSNYGYASYPLPSFVYAMLHFELGDELFLKCYREYIRRWAKKSPTPYDFFYTFENVSGRDLSWLWKPWFFEFGYADLAIKSLAGGVLEVENKGNRPVPVKVEYTFKDGGTKVDYAKPSAWREGRTCQFTVPEGEEIASVSVNQEVPDAHELDNFFPPLKERYAGVALPGCLEGAYALQEFPVELTISRKEGLLYLKVDANNMASYLVPEDGDGKNFRSLDGSIKAAFEYSEEGCSGIVIQYFGYRITGKKI